MSGSRLCTAASLAPMSTRPRRRSRSSRTAISRLVGEPEQPLRVVLQQAAGLGQRAVAGRAVEQPLAELVLEPADRLADGRLGAVQPPAAAEKLRSVRDGEKRRQIRQLHKQLLI